MIKLKTILGALLLSASLCQNGFAADLKLKAQVEVTEGVVTLGDLIENLQDKANIAVFRAPSLGESGTIQAARVIEAASRHGITWNHNRFAEEIVVTRAARTISADEIADAIARHLQTATSASKFEVILPTSFKSVAVEPNLTAALEVRELTQMYGNRVRATLGLEGSDVLATGITLEASAYEVVDVVMTSKSIGRGDIISASDVEIVSLRKDRAGFDPITNPADVIGQSARLNLIAGRTIRSNDVEAPKLVSRGNRVLMVFARPGLTLTVAGQAMQDGAEGDLIKVINPNSNRILEGVVARDGRVIINGQITLAQALQGEAR